MKSLSDRAERVLVVLPVFNERLNLVEVLRELRAARPTDSIVIVDDSSTDGTGALARELGQTVLELPFHLGYGPAVQAGIKYGVHHGFDIIVTFDADGQHDPSDVSSLVLAVQQGADVVIGSRRLARGAFAGNPIRRVGRSFFALLLRSLTGLALTDPTSGLKALGPRAQALFVSTHFPDQFPDADALLVVGRAGLRIKEVPANMRASRNHHSMHDGYRAVAYIFNMLFSMGVAVLGPRVDQEG